MKILNEENEMTDKLKKFKGSEDYVVTQELMNAVNVAIALQKPLLIKGEPGTGKTMLAESISEALNMKLLIWNIKSTTKAQEGLYVYDTVQRLYDSQFGEGDVSNIKKYIKLGTLGEAFTSDEQVVLLIDEIDKADLEFPNDLLWELDKMEFYVTETKETIVNFHFYSINDNLLNQAMDAFYKIRDMRDIQKKPSTSELLDWLQALILSGIAVERITEEIPYAGVLLKKNQDIDAMFEIKEKGYSLK